MNEDKLVIALHGLKLAVDTAEVAGIVAVRHATYLPHQSGVVSGIISLRGEPVTVIDVCRAFDYRRGEPNGARELKVVVVRDAKRAIGLDVGTAEISFLWKEELKKSVLHEGGAGFSRGTIELDRDIFIIVDWRALFDEASRALTTQKEHV